MTKQNTTVINDEIVSNIRSFLASPPEGTPTEILEAFDVIGTRVFLPPKLFLETVEQAPIAISIADPRAKILYVNSAFEELTGFKREEVIGENESILSSKSTPLSVYQDLWRIIQSKRVWRGTLVNHRKDKQEYLAELTISPVLTPKNDIGYFLGMHRDITEIHKLQQRLKFQKSLTEAALDAAPMIVAMVGADRKVLLDNLAYKTLQTDFGGIEPAGLFLEALEQQDGFNLHEYKPGQGFSYIEIRLDPPGSNSPRWFSCSGVLITELDEAAQNYFKGSGDSSRCCLLLIANEITTNRCRINEARLNMIRASMAEQQMVQTMRESISAAIYKLQVPLNVIKAAMAMPPSNERCSLHNTLQEALESGDEAMDSLHAALPNPDMEQAFRININEILHEVIKLSTDKLLASTVVIDWRPATVLPGLTGRANALRGLFKYLIENSIKAVNESDQNNKEIRLQTRLDNQDLLIEVIDNGVGIAKTQRLKVFEPFYSSWEQRGEHAGMGLTMAQEVAINHGGSVEVDPEFYGGCRVTVRLPLNGLGGD